MARSTASVHRKLGFWMATALVVGNMIGSGIFLLPATLAPYGWNAVYGWGLTIAGALCVAFVFAGLGRAMPQAGPYGYARAAFGPGIAFVTIWSYWISVWVGIAAIAVAAVSYLGLFLPAIGATPGVPALLACMLLWLLTAVSLRGARAAGEVQVATVLLKLVPLVAVVALVLVLLAGGETPPPITGEPVSLGAVSAAATLALWAMLGIESASVPSEKIEDPARTIPHATVAGAVTVGALYVAVTLSVLMLLPEGQAAASQAPLADAVARHLGSGFGEAVALFAAVSCIGTMNGYILIQGELPCVMARDGVFPAWFAKQTRNGMPARALLVSSGLATLLVVANYARSLAELFTFMALLSTTANLVLFVVVCGAALRLGRRGLLRADRLLPVTAVAGLTFSLWAIFGAGREAVLWGIALLAAGAPVYWLMRRSGAAKESPAV